ncbi:MAG: TRAP transporter large permease subunit [Pseudomonadota bacterium]
MAEPDASVQNEKPAVMPLLFWLSVMFVVVGMLNAMPGIPGLDQWAKDIMGNQNFLIRKYPFEYYYPLAFAVMMLIVALKHSVWRAWRDKGAVRRRFGLAMDIALVAMAFTISFTYLAEIEAVCIIDQFTGDRARMMAESLQIEKENAALFGLPEPTTVDDPQCLNTTGGWLVLIVGVAIVVFLTYNVKVWGLPLVLVAILVAAYTIGTVFVWYFYGVEDINKYLVTKIGGEPRLLTDGRPRVHDILVNNASGLLGRFMDIILNEIFPYLILGALFGASAGGRSLIKLAFRWTRHLRGGPAHAAIVSSAMFGTISGGPIVNVLSTGVLTIPMMIKRGFSKVFAGGTEAAASSGGSIMPPVMGVAAFVLAALTGVPYNEVIIAAALPALAYFTCLFLSVMFQARKQKITAIGELTDDMHIGRQDVFNLVMIFLPILIILVLLLTSKESIGCGPMGWLLGVERVFSENGCRAQNLPWFLKLIQNAAGDAGSAGWWAVIILCFALFLDPEMRAKPFKLLESFADAGMLIATLYLMFLAVSIIDFCLKFTGMPFFISLDVLQWLQSMNLGSGGSVVFQFVALFVTMLLAVLLGMGMPAVPAYINVALLMGPVLAGLGISLFAANMFIFYFAVASAITPPVALAAFAAASITKAEPMTTAFSAVKVGIVMFVIPFIFAFYPELLLIEAAVIDPSTTEGAEIKYLPGYDGSVDWGVVSWLLVRLFGFLFLLASALARFDRAQLSYVECAARLGLAVLILANSPLLQAVGIVGATALLVLHWARNRHAPSIEAT